MFLPIRKDTQIYGFIYIYMYMYTLASYPRALCRYLFDNCIALSFPNSFLKIHIGLVSKLYIRSHPCVLWFNNNMIVQVSLLISAIAERSSSDLRDDLHEMFYIES